MHDIRPVQEQRGMAHASRKPGRVRGNVAWLEQAACRGHDPEMWFDPARYQDAKKICNTCPVILRCREYGKREPDGVWGGRIHGAIRRPRTGPEAGLYWPVWAHGTYSGFLDHLGAGETPCAACKAADAWRRRRNRERQ